MTMRLPSTASRALHSWRPADKRFSGNSPSLSPWIRSPSPQHRACCCQAEAGETDGEVKSELERIIRRKADEIQDQIEELGLDWLEEKLQDSVEVEAQLPEERQFWCESYLFEVCRFQFVPTNPMYFVPVQLRTSPD